MTALPPCVDADSELAKRVRIFLVNSRGELGGLEVQVQDGVVTLAGSVPTFYLRQLATACARRVAGVRNIIDGIEVFDHVADGHEMPNRPHLFAPLRRAHEKSAS
jgi:hypothetical protein